MALSCKETFSLLYYEHDGLHKEPPPWEPESYKLIDRIAADEGRFTSNSEVCIATLTLIIHSPYIIKHYQHRWKENRHHHSEQHWQLIYIWLTQTRLFELNLCSYSRSSRSCLLLVICNLQLRHTSSQTILLLLLSSGHAQEGQRCCCWTVLLFAYFRFDISQCL